MDVRLFKKDDTYQTFTKFLSFNSHISVSTKIDFDKEKVCMHKLSAFQGHKQAYTKQKASKQSFL